MRIVIITIFVLIQVGFLFGQDGSDINYIKPENLNSSHIGRIIQIDFFRRSFGGLHIDKILIDVNSKQIEFIEHREDDGFNAWFAQQYLESVDAVDGKKIIIKEFKLIKIEKESILVIGYFTDKSFTKELSFKKSEIAELLFKDD